MRSTQYAPVDVSADTALLDMLTSPAPETPAKGFACRDASLDPLLIAAAAASGPHVTRNHYHHDFFPGVMLPLSEGSWDWKKWSGEDSTERKRFTYVSRQAPRKQRLQLSTTEEQPGGREILKSAENLPLSPPRKRHSSIISTLPEGKADDSKPAKKAEIFSSATIPTCPSIPVEVKCMARTRIPTLHGPAFLHLYHNNQDQKEHLAVVIDPAQFIEDFGAHHALPIRSRSLDAIWSDDETPLERIIRGAYNGRLSPTSQNASASSGFPEIRSKVLPAPLIRIHSECFTGETIGSMRCDCGEQLDEAIRLISQSITITLPGLADERMTIPGRGAVIYLRQEGRGIGLLSKIRAYNLQDLGHDTVTANLMLGHQADERGYEIAGAILRDLGIGSGNDLATSEGIRLLTNNPDKVEALRREGVRILERVPMIPRSWKQRLDSDQDADSDDRAHCSMLRDINAQNSNPSAQLVGGKVVHGDDLDKYLRTKITRMGHMLPLWMEDRTVY